MRLLYTAATTHASFDDPNLVSHAGLVPAARLAQNIGLEVLGRQRVAGRAPLLSQRTPENNPGGGSRRMRD
jgi:hypothetical protein